MIDFFQTLNIKRFVFSDGDNVNNPKAFIDFLHKKDYLNLETQIICFLGANRNQNTWYNTATKYIQSLRKTSSINITPIRIRTEASNALDMVLAAYAGLSMAQNAASEFIIVSADKGYDAVVEHFSSLGIAIRRESIRDDEKKPDPPEAASGGKGGEQGGAGKPGAREAARQSQLDDHISEVILKLEKHNKAKLPRGVPALKNFLLVSFRAIVDSSSVESFAEMLLDELKRRGKVSLKGQRIFWK